MRCLCHVFSWLTQCNQAFPLADCSEENPVPYSAGSHENVPPDVVKPAGVVMKTARHLHRHNNRGET